MNEYDSVQPAYENGPKEVNAKRRVHNSKRQFGDGFIEQINKPILHKKPGSNIKSHNRHREYR